MDDSQLEIQQQSIYFKGNSVEKDGFFQLQQLRYPYMKW